MTIRGATPSRRNFTALPIRFCHSIASSVGSPSTWGSGRAGRTISAPDSSIEVARLLSAVSSAASRSTSVCVALSRPTREKVSRSLISTCIRLAPSTAKPMYSVPRSSSLSPYRFSSSWQNDGDLAQRLLQVVRRDVGELLEFGVGPPQLVGLFVERLAWPTATRRVRRRSAAACSRRRPRWPGCPWARAERCVLRSFPR